MVDPRSGTGNFCSRKTGRAGPREVQIGKPESKFSLPATSRARRDRYAVFESFVCQKTAMLSIPKREQHLQTHKCTQKKYTLASSFLS